MLKSVAVILTALGIVSLAGTAVACPMSTSSSSQQTVMTDSTTTQTPMPTKPGG